MNSRTFDWLNTLILPMPATLGTVNCYLIKGHSRVVLIDTGMSAEESRASLSEQFERLGMTFSDVDIVLCTHNHPDHCGIGRTFQQAGAKVLMSKGEATSLSRFFANPHLDSERSTFYGKHAVPEDFSYRLTKMFQLLRGFHEPFVPDDILEDGQILDLGGITLQVISTPGHTIEHLCFLQPDRGVLFTGDHLLANEASHVSMREECIRENPLAKLISSFEKLVDLKNVVGCTGHGGNLEDVSSRAQELIEFHQSRLLQIKAGVKETPLGCYDICKRVWGEKRRIFSKWLSMARALSYLEYLVNMGDIIEEPMKDGVVAYRRLSSS